MRLIDNTSKDTLTGQKTGTGETRGYKFDANNAFFFKSMIDSLYADKVASVVREIIANAFDAHAMSPTPVTRAVEVSLPTMFSQTFSVRDFGPGMTHDFVMELYTTLGHSSKTKTNAATGMFGLGAKTPFAVADSFEVRVYQDAQCRTYQCSFAANGCPELTHVNTVASTEPSGVKVTMPITDRGKQAEFERAIENAGLCYFDKNITFNRPSSSGASMVDLARHAVTKTGDNFFTRKSSSGHRSSSDTILVRQGFAVYPLDLRKLGLRMSPGFLSSSDILRSVVDVYITEVMIDCPIGTFEVTPSRELIQYTDFSTKNLTKVVGEAIENARESLYAAAKGAKTIQELIAALAPANVNLRDASAYSILIGKMEFFGTYVAKNFRVWAAKNKIECSAVSTYDTRNGNGFSGVLSEFKIKGLLHGAFSSATWDSAVKTTIGAPGVTAYDGRTAEDDTHCAFDKDTETIIHANALVLFIPNDVRHWEDKAHHYIRSVQKVYDVRLSKIASVVFRGPVAELARVQEWLEAHHCARFILPPAEGAKLVDPPKPIATRSNRIVKPRPANNDAYVLRGSSWEEEKNVDFSKPCFIVVRDRRHGNVEIASASARILFNDKKLGAATSFGGLDLRASVAEHSLISLIRAARALDLLDVTVPIYSLRRAQYDALVNNGVALELLNTKIVACVEKAANEAVLALKARALLAGQDWTTGNNGALRALLRAGGRNEFAARAAVAVASDLLAVTRVAAHSVMTSAYHDDLSSPNGRLYGATVRQNASRNDDFLSLTCANYSSCVSAHSYATTLPHMAVTLYPLISRQFSESAFDNAEWAQDAARYIELKAASTPTVIKQATDLLNTLPVDLRQVVTDEVKFIRQQVAQMAAKFTKTAPVATKTVAAA